MACGNSGICVRILEKEYRVACPPEQEPALMDAADYLDQQMRQIRQTGRVNGAERIAIMAALNIAHELLMTRAGTQKADSSLSERLLVLKEQLDDVLNKYA